MLTGAQLRSTAHVFARHFCKYTATFVELVSTAGCEEHSIQLDHADDIDKKRTPEDSGVRLGGGGNEAVASRVGPYEWPAALANVMVERITSIKTAETGPRTLHACGPTHSGACVETNRALYTEQYSEAGAMLSSSRKHHVIYLSYLLN